MDPFLEKYDLPIKMNYAAAQGYVPRAEKIIHDIRKGVWESYHRFLLMNLLRILVKYLVMESTKKVIFFKQTWCVKVFQSALDNASRKIGLQTSLQFSK